MKTKLISKRMLNLFVAVVMLISLGITFATPASADIACQHPDVYLCEGTEVNDTNLMAQGVGCIPAPGHYDPDGIPDSGDEYTVTIDIEYIPAATENTTPAAGTYGYHVYCWNYPDAGGGECVCNHVGNIYILAPCTASADNFTICVGDSLTGLYTSPAYGNASCSGGCGININDTAVNNMVAGEWPYTVTCDNGVCDDAVATAYVTVEECVVEECCECYAPDVTICAGEDVTAAITAAGVSCTGDGCLMTLDISGVNNMVPDDYSYTVTCADGDIEICQGTVTVVPACVASAPDITICQFETPTAPGNICTAECDVNVDFSEVDNCTPGFYSYYVTCTDPCEGECGNDVAVGQVEVQASLGVEIIEAAGYEKYTDNFTPCSDNFVGYQNCDWKDVCPPPTGPDPGGRMIVPVSSVYAVKAVINNTSGCLLYDVTPYIIIDGPAELVEDMPDHWNLGNMEGGADADCTEVAWTLHCTDPGMVTVTVMINNCAMDTVCFDQRIPGELELTCDTVCEVCTDCQQDDFPVNAHITNIGQTAIEEVFATITWDHIMATVDLPVTQGPFTILPGVTKDLIWDAECKGIEGTANFTITVTGWDTCENEAITPLVCHTSTEQVDITVKVLVDPLACGTLPAANGIVVSRLQQFEVIADINNCSTEDELVDITLTLPANSSLSGAPVRIKDPVTAIWYTVPSSATITHLTICDCCTATIIWPLVCDGPTGVPPAPVPVVVTVESDCCTYTNACNPASITQEEKVHLTPSMDLFVEDCETACWIPVEVVAEGQDYNVKIWVENSGDAVAENVTMDINVSGNTTCIGFYDDMVFGDGIIPGNTMEWVWLSDLIDCPELYCLAEGDVTVTLTDLKGIDENTCLAVLEENIDDVCPLEFPQCDIDIEIINPVTCTDIEQWEVFAVKARVTNCGECSFEDAALTLMWEGAVELVGSVNPAVLVEILAPDENCLEDCRTYEATWMMRCIGAPGEVFFDVCLETATPHLQIKTVESTNVHQVPRDQAMVCVDILSPDTGSKYATSEEFAITAKITNLECCAPVTINKATIDIGGIPGFEENIEVSDPMPPLDWVIDPGESKIVTWTAHCTGSGLSWFNVHLEGISDEYEPVYIDSEPVSVWQYPAAHLEVEITGYPEEPIVTSTIFDVMYTVTNTGEADATEVYATLSVEPEGSVRIAGPSDNGYTQYLGTIPGHGSEVNSVTANYTLHCKLPCDSTIKITVEGNDEYGWHMKQQCASTGSFVIEGGVEMVEGLNDGFIVDMPDDGWFAGIFFGDANGLFGPFNATSPVSWAAMGGGPDYTGDVALMGAVIPSVSMTTAEMLSTYMCTDSTCLYNPDCDCQCMCELIEGRDVMIFIGHITSDSEYDYLPDGQDYYAVGPGLLNIINGQFSGSYFMHEFEGGITWVKSLLGGEYCTNMAATAGIPILDGFIEPDEVTVKQLPMLADLDIDKGVDEPSPTMGDTVEFTVTLDNLGPSDATNVLVMDVLPAGLGYEGCVPSQGWYDETSGYWAVGDLTADAAPITLVITAVVNTVGDVCNRATVVALDEHDPVTTNNMAEVCLNAGEADPVDSVILNLDDGLNLISLPLIPDLSDPEDALAGVNAIIAYQYRHPEDAAPSGWVSYTNGTTWNPASGFVWDDGIGYWMNMVSPADDLVVAGQELESGAILPPSYDVYGGWNLIGFKSTTAKLPTEYLAGIAGKYVMIYGYDNGAFYAVGSPGHAMLVPYYGYWLAVIDTKVGAEGTIYP